MHLPLGKVPAEVLQKMVIQSLVPDKDVVVGPEIGVDFAVVDLDGKYLIVASDPITGVQSNIGWYAVNVCANDVATSGSRPRFLETVILLPRGAKSLLVGEISQQISSAASKLQMSIIGGHTELTQGIDRPIVVVTAMGFADKFVTSRDVREGDVMMVTKTAAIEGTAILATAFKDKLVTYDSSIMKKVDASRSKISVVEDAVTAFETGFIHAMHDPTEGGILGGAYEMSVSSKVGFEILEEDVPIASETKTICEVLNIDPLKLISSGSLLMAVDPEGVEDVRLALRKSGIDATEVGRFREQRRILTRKDGYKESVNESPVDELWITMGDDGYKVK